MQALASISDELVVCVPIRVDGDTSGEVEMGAKNLRVVELPVPPGRGIVRKVLLPFWAALLLPRLIGEARKADVVHAPIPGDVGTLGIALAELLRKPLFVRYCGDWSRNGTTAERLWKRYMEFAASRPRRLMLATGGHATPPSPAHPEVRWIFSTSMTKEEVDARARVRELPASGPVRLITVGRQVEAKGTGLAVRAVAEVTSRGREVRLDVVGDGPRRSAFEDLAAQLGVADRVTFHGQVGHELVLDVLDAGDVFLFPTSSNEGFPKAVGEALACGLPVVASAVSVLPSLLEDGAGIVLREVTSRAIANAVEDLSSAPDAYAAMSRRATELAQTLTLERWATEVERAIDGAGLVCHTRSR